ncbi:MAG: 2-deoxyribose-5-phosphate aldolase [Acidobacteriaceae bacterium]|nr:2-deoxyribose-5-phosphate aldolase [Acidobacteriaceae bacterium]
MSISVPDPTTFDAASFAAQALSSPAALAAVLDHTLLKPDATRTQVLAICEEAAKYKFACAMVNPFWTGTAAAALKGTGVPVGVVIGFPLGATLTASKKEEAGRVLALGAHDVDMVLNIGLLKSGEFDAVKHDIHIVAEVVHAHGGILKEILETGFSTGGATVDDIQLMRGVAGIRCGVKASGGIRSLADAQAMLFAGATRIGASASVRIVNELANPTDAAGVPTGGY